MNVTRSIVFGIALFVCAIAFGMLNLAIGWATPEVYSLKAYGLTWLLYIPTTLLLAKWYFKMVTPTIAIGFQLGLIAVVVHIAIHGLIYLGLVATGGDASTVVESLTGWEYYVTLTIILFTTTFAGFEFDGTYSMPERDSAE